MKRNGSYTVIHALTSSGNDGSFRSEDAACACRNMMLTQDLGVENGYERVDS